MYSRLGFLVALVLSVGLWGGQVRAASTTIAGMTAVGSVSDTDLFADCALGNCPNDGSSPVLKATAAQIALYLAPKTLVLTNKTISCASNTCSVGFNFLTAGTNTAALVVGTGGSLSASGTGTITATALAAAGVPAVGQTLNAIQAAKSGSYELVAGDRFTIIPVVTTSFATITLDQIASNYFPAGSAVRIVNGYTGTSAGVTSIDVVNKAGSTSVFNYVPLNSSGAFFLQPGQWAYIVSDGTNYNVIKGGDGLPGADIKTTSPVTLDVYDCDQVVWLNVATATEVVAQTGMPSNCMMNMVRIGAGQAHFAQVASPSGGFTMHSLSAQTHDAGQYSGMTLTIYPGGTTGYLTGALAP